MFSVVCLLIMRIMIPEKGRQCSLKLADCHDKVRESGELRDVFADAEGQRHDCQNWVEAAVGDVQGTIDDVEIVMPVNAPIGVCDICLRVVAHAPGSRLMLPRAARQSYRIAPDPLGPTAFEPL